MSNNATSTLNSLKFVTQSQPAAASTVSPEQRRRNALIARLEEQIALASAQADGKTFTATRTKTVTKDGQKVKEQATKKLRPWYWQAGKTFFVQVRYGASLLVFKGGNNAVETNSLKGVVAVLNTIKQAVAAGELDSAVAQVVSKRGAAKKAAAK